MRLEEAIMEMSWVESEEVGHTMGFDIDLIERLVPDEVSPRKLKTRQNLCNRIGYEVCTMGLAIKNHKNCQ